MSQAAQQQAMKDPRVEAAIPRRAPPNDYF